jgi:hypothetical protein
VIGLSANRSPLDWIYSAAQVIAVSVVDRVRRPAAYAGAVVAEPRESVAEIRRAMKEILPGATLRRRFYYRYEIRWRRPATAH